MTYFLAICTQAPYACTCADKNSFSVHWSRHVSIEVWSFHEPREAIHASRCTQAVPFNTRNPVCIFGILRHNRNSRRILDFQLMHAQLWCSNTHCKAISRLETKSKRRNRIGRKEREQFRCALLFCAKTWSYRTISKQTYLCFADNIHSLYLISNWKKNELGCRNALQLPQKYFSNADETSQEAFFLLYSTDNLFSPLQVISQLTYRWNKYDMN